MAKIMIQSTFKYIFFSQGFPKSIAFLVLMLSAFTLSAPEGLLDRTNTTIQKELDNLKNAPEVMTETFEKMHDRFSVMYDKVKEATEKIDSIKRTIVDMGYKSENLNTAFLDEYDEVRLKLGKTRQKLKKLAKKTISMMKSLKNYLNELETNPDITLLTKFIENVKDLMTETDEQLKAANVEYEEAVEKIAKFKTNMIEFARQLTSQLQINEEEYAQYAEELRAGVYSSCSAVSVGMVFADIFGCFGLCSATATTSCWTAGLASVETTLAEYAATNAIADRKLEKMKKSVLDYVGKTDLVIGFVEREVSSIDQWKLAADSLDDEINENEVEYLTEFKADRQDFMGLVDDLQKAAQNFLDQPISFFN